MKFRPAKVLHLGKYNCVCACDRNTGEEDTDTIQGPGARRGVLLVIHNSLDTFSSHTVG